VHNIMSVSSPLYCLQVQVGPVITKGKCAVGGCSDWSMSGCRHLTLQMDGPLVGLAIIFSETGSNTGV